MANTLPQQQTWAELDAAGVYDSTQYKKFPSSKLDYVPCTKGYASYVPNDPKYTFRCNNLDLYDFKTHAELGSSSGRGAGSWGWTSPKGREFVAIAQEDGTAFAEVTKKGKLVYLGRLPQYTTAQPSLWREIKGYKSYILIGSEAVNHGVQIFDLAKLQDVDPANPKVFTNENDLDGWWTEGLPVGRSHNVVTNEEKKYGVAVGFQPRTGPLRAGLVFFDLTDPKNPKTLGGSGEDGYVHDAQCIVYRGPDIKYYGKDICYGYDEDSLTMLVPSFSPPHFFLPLAQKHDTLTNEKQLRRIRQAKHPHHLQHLVRRRLLHPPRLGSRPQLATILDPRRRVRRVRCRRPRRRWVPHHLHLGHFLARKAQADGSLQGFASWY